MANDSKRVSQLGVTTTLTTTDRVVVLMNPSGTPNTQTITVNNFINSTVNNFPVANTTHRGLVLVDGTTILAAANGQLSAAQQNLQVDGTTIVAAGNGQISAVQQIDLANITADIIPVSDNTFNLGNSSNQWKSLHVSANTIYVGGTPLSIQGGQLTVNGSAVAANTGNLFFANSTMYSNTSDAMYLLSPNNNIYVNSQQLTQLAATQNAANNAESGNSQSYVWAYQGGNDYSEVGMYVQSHVSANNSNLVSTNAYLNPNGQYYFAISEDGVGPLPLKLLINEAATYSFDGDGNFISPGSVLAANGDIGIGSLMGPAILANGSLIAAASFATNTEFVASGTSAYPGTYQIFVERYNPTQNYNYAVTLYGDEAILTSDVSIISSNNIAANNDIIAGKDLTVGGNIMFSGKGNVVDNLMRPLLNVNALDINADGGTTSTVFGPSDIVFDGGAGETVFGAYEAALDGGVSFNNRHSASYIDGGGANQF